jgi:hypothetical protein
MCSIVVRAGMLCIPSAAVRISSARLRSRLALAGLSLSLLASMARDLSPQQMAIPITCNCSGYFLQVGVEWLSKFRLTNENEKGTIGRLSQGRRDMDPDRRNAWLRKLDEECPYQVVLPRRQLADDSAIMNFLMNYVGKFDMYVEDEYAAFVRYCFADPLDAAIFRSRFEPKVERLKLAG